LNSTDVQLYIDQISAGLGIDTQVANAQDCVDDSTNIIPLFQTTIAAMQTSTDKFTAWLDVA